MIGNVRIIQFASAAIAACSVFASAPASAQGVKIGVLNDQSGVYADFGGKWSVEAAKMAIEDLAAACWAARSSWSALITRTSPISPPPSRAAGATPKAST